MKKVISLLLVAAMILTLAACGGSSAPANNTANNVANEAGNETGNETGNTDEPNPDEGGETPVTIEHPGQIFFENFKKIYAEDKTLTAEAIATQLCEKDEIELGLISMAMEEGFLNGFKSEIKGFEEAAVFSPMIGSIPFVGYVFKLAEGADVNAFMDTLKSEADLRWNVCTAADELICENVDNTVFFIMAPNAIEW